MGRKKRLQYRRAQTCWIVWTWDATERPVVAVYYWRQAIYMKKVETRLPESAAAGCWWRAEEAAKAWARRKGFKIIKEKLHGGK